MKKVGFEVDIMLNKFNLKKIFFGILLAGLSINPLNVHSITVDGNQILSTYEDAKYFYRWMLYEYPPMPEIEIDGETISWYDLYEFQIEPVLVKIPKYPFQGLADDTQNILEVSEVLPLVSDSCFEQESLQDETVLLDNLESSEGNTNSTSNLNSRSFPNENSTRIGKTEENESIYVSPCFVRSVYTVGINNLWPTNLATGDYVITTGSSKLDLTGNGIKLAMWEAPDFGGGVAVQTNHAQFLVNGKTRVSQSDLDPISSHATSIAGALIGNGTYTPEARGICYEGELIAYGVEKPENSVMNMYDAGDLSDVQLVNNSFAIEAGWVRNKTNDLVSDYTYRGNGASDWKFGAYFKCKTDSYDKDYLSPYRLDEYTSREHSKLLVFPTGNTRIMNNGDEGGYDTISPTGCAKNVLTVGGVHTRPIGGSISSVTLTSYTGFGPTDDGRIKPEIVAPAATDTNLPGFLLSVYNNNSNESAYANQIEGTSFAAATVTGGLGLVLQERKKYTNEFRFSSTLRALAVHTATPLSTNQGPSYQYGYGLFNAAAAASLVAADAKQKTLPYIKEVIIPYNINLQKYPIQFKVKAIGESTPLKVTTAWIDDEPGSTQTPGVEDETDSRLVYDLDLRIYAPGETNFTENTPNVFKPFILNPDFTGKSASERSAPATTGNDNRNNLEQVLITNPIKDGEYTVRITRSNNKSDLGRCVSIILSGVKPEEEQINLKLIPIENGDLLIRATAIVGGTYSLESSSSLNGNYQLLTSVSNSEVLDAGGYIAYQEYIDFQVSRRMLQGSSQKFFRVVRVK